MRDNVWPCRKNLFNILLDRPKFSSWYTLLVFITYGNAYIAGIWHFRRFLFTIHGAMKNYTLAMQSDFTKYRDRAQKWSRKLNKRNIVMHGQLVTVLQKRLTCHDMLVCCPYLLTLCNTSYQYICRHCMFTRLDNFRYTITSITLVTVLSKTIKPLY